MRFIIAGLLASSLACFATAKDAASPIQVETLMQTTSAWDGTPYRSYPGGQPQITILKYTIAPQTTMKWHSHPMPNAGYILSGELTIEKKDGTAKHFVAGQAITETVDSIHRGITGAEPLVLIVFYPGTPGLPISTSEQ
jgi:quercetin dioxygenase-like cupin family protein